MPDHAHVAPSPALLERFVSCAVLAPSSHNTQPWRFEALGEYLEVRADRSRRLPINDPDDRELTISCGCAILNFRIAAAHAGFSVAVQLTPDPADPDLLARLRLAPAARPSDDAELFVALSTRRTIRDPFAPRRVEPDLLAELARVAHEEGAWLRVLETDEQRRRAAELVAEGDMALWSNPRWRRELAAWMHARGRGDGLAVPLLAAPVTRLFIRHVDMGKRMASKDEQLALASPVLSVLGTEHDDVAAWLRAGQALERVLLAAAHRGVQASYLNQPVQVEALRPRLAALIEPRAAPQVLLRFGYPRTRPSTPARRPVGEVLARP